MAWISLWTACFSAWSLGTGVSSLSTLTLINGVFDGAWCDGQSIVSKSLFCLSCWSADGGCCCCCCCCRSCWARCCCCRCRFLVVGILCYLSVEFYRDLINIKKGLSKINRYKHMSLRLWMNYGFSVSRSDGHDNNDDQWYNIKWNWKSAT